MKNEILDFVIRIFINSMTTGLILVGFTLLYQGFGKIEPLYYFTIATISVFLCFFMAISSMRFTARHCEIEEK